MVTVSVIHVAMGYCHDEFLAGPVFQLHLGLCIALAKRSLTSVENLFDVICAFTVALKKQ